MVSVLTLSVVDRGFEPISDQTKDYAIGICYFHTKHSVDDIRRLWLYCLNPFNFVLADYLCLYCLGPLSFLLADYGYID